MTGRNKTVQGIIQLYNHFPRINRRSISNWLDKVTFLHILCIWLSVVLAFALVYFFLPTQDSFLYSVLEKQPIRSFLDALHFSFMSAVTVSFGNILPFGFFKLISMAEILFAFLLLAVVTSKLVSIKQDIILGELYEISFDERVNQIRSSLLLFRQNLDRLMDKSEEGSLQKREVLGLHTHLTSLEDVIGEVRTMITKQGHYHFIKHIDAVNAELIFNSLVSSFERLGELLTLLNKKKIVWKTEVNILVLKKCLEVNDSLFTQVHASSLFTREIANELNAQKNKAVEEVRAASLINKKIKEVEASNAL